MRKVNVLAYRFGKGAEIHDCSEAPARIYTSMQDMLFGQNFVFSWQETIPEGYCFGEEGDPSAGKPSSIKNKAIVVNAVTSLAQHVALTLLTDDGWPLVIGGDHTQALGASKGLILAETVRAVLEGRLRLSAGGNAWMMHLKNTIAQHDITAVTLQMETLVYYCITQEDLAQFLASFYVIWFDAHGDYNTEATTPSGNAHGMGAAAISGEGDPALTGILGGWAKVLPENMHFVAVRDLDREEEALMREKNVHMYPMELIHEQGLPQVMEGIIASIHRDALSKTGLPAIIHLSFDIDGIDAKYVPATGTPVGAGSTRNPALGPSLDETVEAFAGIADQVALIDVAESNFSPERDPEDITFYSVNRVLASFFAENRAQLFGEDRVQKRAR